APIATLVGLACQLHDPDNLLGDTGKEGITCALLPYTHKGLEIGKRGFPLGQTFMNGYIKAKDEFIPIDCINGEQKIDGEGWRMLV
ncbi:acyl-CoA dehydrogenase, partial [Francisella tularensis subsp. holarctica]|nr:acyl-CoA dehydrogenase [Francisella tularensis subsp. holarctica]